MYRLLVSDVDGTLIDDNYNVPERNRTMIERGQREKNIIFCLCSGRTELSLHSLEKELNLLDEENYGIAFNGSMVYENSTRKVIRDIRLDRDLTFNIVKELDDFPLITMIYSGNRIYVREDNEDIRKFEKFIESPVEIVSSFEKVKGGFTKIQVRSLCDELATIEPHLSKIAEGRCNSFFGSQNLYEYCPTEATKGYALEFLANHLGIPMEETIAIGDYFNDLHMISVAGLGVCVKNGAGKVKEYANYVTESTNNEGAVGEVYEKFIFN